MRQFNASGLRRLTAGAHRDPERATSEAIPAGSDDIMLNLEVADKIKGKDVAPEKAMRAIKARLEHRNPNVQLLALKVGPAPGSRTSQCPG